MHGKIAVFCSASNNIDPEFNKVARDFVRAASLRGYAIVSGGTVKGTMGQIDSELSGCGGYHIGIIPEFMKDIVAPGLSETHWTDTMAARQAMMRKGTLAAVALPGGIGTLDEIFHVMASATIGYHSKQVIFYNINGFWDDILHFFDRLEKARFAHHPLRQYYKVANTFEELTELLK